MLVYLFSLMTVFLTLAWLHSSAGVDCTDLSQQMTGIWTVRIWHAFICAGSEKAIFRWLSHFLASFVVLVDHTLPRSFICTNMQLSNLSLTFEYISPGKCAMHIKTPHKPCCIDLFMGSGGLTIALLCVCSAPHLSPKGQGTQTLHSAHFWWECLILQP